MYTKDTDLCDSQVPFTCPRVSNLAVLITTIAPYTVTESEADQKRQRSRIMMSEDPKPTAGTMAISNVIHSIEMATLSRHAELCYRP
jgi:hypothetical protein